MDSYTGSNHSDWTKNKCCIECYRVTYSKLFRKQLSLDFSLAIEECQPANGVSRSVVISLSMESSDSKPRISITMYSEGITV